MLVAEAPIDAPFDPQSWRKGDVMCKMNNYSRIVNK